MTKDFLQVADLSPDELFALLDLARDMKKDRGGWPGALDGQHVVLLFEKPSLRTRVTFEVAARELGGEPLTLTAAEVGLDVRESVEDVARNLERWVGFAIVRTFAHALVERLAAAAPRLHVVNALSDEHHPCQALADLLTLRERLHDLHGRKLCFVGDGNNVCHSLVQAAALSGMHMAVATPQGYTPDAGVVAGARRAAQATRARLELGHDPAEAVRGADAVYTDVWASMGQEKEAKKRRRLFKPYQVNAALLRHARPDALVMHCLPAHRGLEITGEALDSPRSVVFDQAENRLHAQKALLASLVAPPGRAPALAAL
jgi:ornithine carbamoyltransferase